MFKELPTESKFPKLEDKITEFWKKNKIFEKSVEQRSKDDLYVFYDGPPFISGLPHYGHLTASIAKDLIPRYWTMKGKRVERVWGWDAHGLTVENKVQKKLKIKNRRDIESYGLEKFTEACYEYTSETSAEWPWYIDKIGRWVDMDNAYKTIDQSYMESVMWAFKQLYDKGLIYEGVRTSLYCTTCGTPVSNFEVAMDNTYKDVEDPAVTVAFEINDVSDVSTDAKMAEKFKGAFILAWTTTPWTLPSNRALVVADKEDYVLAQNPQNNKKYIVAKNLQEKVFGEDANYHILAEFKGSELVGIKYTPLYEFFKSIDKEFKVYSYEGMANVNDGTGIVHSAPGFGEVDTAMGTHFDLTIMQTIDDEGKFIVGNNGENPFEGFYYKKADKYIRQDLQERGLLFKDETIVHRFPYHDRCDTLLIQRAQDSWFVDVNTLRKDLIKNNENINWIPEKLKYNRFKKGIEQAPDWCISRSRFWATPMPVWQNEDGDRIVVGSIAELEKLSGQKVKDLHRPYIDEITIEKDGKTYKRIPEVLDSWFEAGSMPYASIHYPYENKAKFDAYYPGDYIVEYIAQTRAWFYVMHVLTTALFGSNSYENAIGYGVLAGNDGRKMSKTYQNYTDPKDVLNTIGGDALRLYFMNSPLMHGENMNLEDAGMKTKAKRVLNPLLNSARFFVTYANLNNFSSDDYVVSKNILDKWIMSKLQVTISTFTTEIEKYTLPPAIEAIETFVDDLSRWYIRRSRDRLSAGDKEALSTLYYVLVQFSKLSAPVIPFLSENVFLSVSSDAQLFEKVFGRAPQESVHLEFVPEYVEEFDNSDSAAYKNMDLVQDMASAGNALRVEAKTSVRQPLATLKIKSETKFSEELGEILLDELNIKNFEFVDSVVSAEGWVIHNSKEFDLALDTNLTQELKVEGAARDFIRKVQSLRKKQGLVVSDNIKVTYESTDLYSAAAKNFEDHIKSKVQATELVSGDAFSVEVV